MDSSGSHPFPAVPKVVACSGLPWTAVSQRVPGAVGVAQVGGKIICALKRSLTHVSSDAVLLYGRPKTFGGLTSWSRWVPSEQATSLWWGAERGLIWSLPPCTICSGLAWHLHLSPGLGPSPCVGCAVSVPCLACTTLILMWLPSVTGDPTRPCCLVWWSADSGWPFHRFSTCSAVLARTSLPLSLLGDTFGLENCIYLE